MTQSAVLPVPRPKTPQQYDRNITEQSFQALERDLQQKYDRRGHLTLDAGKELVLTSDDSSTQFGIGLTAAGVLRLRDMATGNLGTFVVNWNDVEGLSQQLTSLRDDFAAADGSLSSAYIAADAVVASDAESARAALQAFLESSFTAGDATVQANVDANTTLIGTRATNTRVDTVESDLTGSISATNLSLSSETSARISGDAANASGIQSNSDAIILSTADIGTNASAITTLTGSLVTVQTDLATETTTRTQERLTADAVIAAGDAANAAGITNLDDRISALGNSAAQLLPNWNFADIDGDGKPAGIQPLQGIMNRDQLSAITNGVRITSSPNPSAGYGFPAIPIDDQITYTIIVQKLSSAASSTGFFFRAYEKGDALSGGKTHIGFAGNEATANDVQTSFVNIASPNSAMPGTTLIEQVYTYTPTAGTKVASFGWINGAGFSGDLDIQAIIVVPSTANIVAEVATKASLTQLAEIETGSETARGTLETNITLSYTSAIALETGNREAGDIAEASARTAAISSEESDRIAGDTANDNARISGDAAEASARTQGLLDEANARASDLLAESNARTTAINSEETDRIAGDAANDSARLAGDVAEATARADDILAETTNRLAGDAVAAAGIDTLNNRAANIAVSSFANLDDWTESRSGAADAVASADSALFVAGTIGPVVRKTGNLIIFRKATDQLVSGDTYDFRLEGRVNTLPSDGLDRFAVLAAALDSDFSVIGSLILAGVGAFSATGGVSVQSEITADAIIAARAGAVHVRFGAASIQGASDGEGELSLFDIAGGYSNRAARDRDEANDTTRIAGDAAEATARATAISDEQTDRLAGDIANATAISNEETSRISGDATNATAISDEETDRIAGDNTNAAAITAGDDALQTQVNARVTQVDYDNQVAALVSADAAGVAATQTLQAAVDDNTATVNTLRLAFVDGNGNAIASLDQIAAADGSTPARIGLRSGDGASEVVLDADNIYLGDDTRFDTASNTFITEKDGYRFRYGASFGSNTNLLNWYGPDTVAENSETKANALFALATDGGVYGGPLTSVVSDRERVEVDTVAGTGGAITWTSDTATLSPQGGSGSYTVTWERTVGPALTVNASGLTVNFSTNETGPSSSTFRAVVTDTITGRKAAFDLKVYVIPAGSGGFGDIGSA